MTWNSVLVIFAVQLLSRVQLFETPRTAARQASLSFTNSRRLLKLMLSPASWAQNAGLPKERERESEGNSTTVYELILEGTLQLPPHLLEVSFKANPYWAEDKCHKKVGVVVKELADLS